MNGVAVCVYIYACLHMHVNTCVRARVCVYVSINPLQEQHLFSKHLVIFKLPAEPKFFMIKQTNVHRDGNIET
jgi:hypothetical protein